MVKIVFNPNHKRVLDSLLLGFPDVRAGKMFGFPGYFVGKKLFACVYEDGVGLKLPRERVGALLDGSTFIPFQPLGRHVMRDWVQINRADSEAYAGDLELFAKSIAFVGGQRE